MVLDFHLKILAEQEKLQKTIAYQNDRLNQSAFAQPVGPGNGFIRFSKNDWL